MINKHKLQLATICALLTTLNVACSQQGDDHAEDTNESTSSTIGGTTTPTSSGQPASVQQTGVVQDLPLMAPPVKAAAPEGFKSSNNGSALGLIDLSSSEFKSRFFEEGPTSIFNILTSIDDRISALNSMASETRPDCMGLDPVEYTITPFGQNVPFFAQCYQNIESDHAEDPGFIQFGRLDDTVYLYSAVGASRVAAIVTPDADATDQYEVHLWMGVGYLNPSSCSTDGSFDGCSYGVIELKADSNERTFEMAVAGIGFGYCGAQLRSDGTSLYAVASQDSPGCSEISTLCVASDDLTSPGTCDASLSTFDLPALGRQATEGTRSWAASQYPSEPNIILDGTPSDSLYFGPVVVTPGVGDFDAGR